jgi:hypothetical protein
MLPAAQEVLLRAAIPEDNVHSGCTQLRELKAEASRPLKLPVRAISTMCRHKSQSAAVATWQVTVGCSSYVASLNGKAKQKCIMTRDDSITGQQLWRGIVRPSSGNLVALPSCQHKEMCERQ